MKELRIKLMERMLGAELTAHLGYEAGQEAPPDQGNRRNGSSSKVLKGQDGEIPISVPRTFHRSGTPSRAPARISPKVSNVNNFVML
jgi:transposase-like protein